MQWQKLARLRPDEMGAILNLEHLGVPVRKRGKAAGLVFGRKRKRAVRKVGSLYVMSQMHARRHKLIPELQWASLTAWIVGSAWGCPIPSPEMVHLQERLRSSEAVGTQCMQRSFSSACTCSYAVTIMRNASRDERACCVAQCC